MSSSIQEIANLEWANYEATVPLTRVTPGLEVVLEPDVILTSSNIFPAPDTTHACLIRTIGQRIEELLTRITDYFAERNLPVTLFLSPACRPADLADRLTERGFVKQKEEEAWLVFDHLADFSLPSTPAPFTIKQVEPADVLSFAQTFADSFELPAELAPALVQLTQPSLDLAGVHHYLALVDSQPVGTLSLLCHRTLGIIGSAGVIPAQRGSRAITSLMVEAARTAQQQGVDQLILQTRAGSRLERLLRMYGFRRLFTRHSYVLP